MDNLLLHSELKFRSNYLTVNYQISDKDVSLANISLLAKLLIESNVLYPTKRKLSLQLSKLFGAEIFYSIKYISNTYIISFALLVTDDKFSSGIKNLSEKGISLLSSMIARGFSGNENELKIAKASLIAITNETLVSPRSKTYRLLMQEIAPKTSLVTLPFGTTKEINAVDVISLKNAHQVLLSAPKEVVYVGNINEKSIKHLNHSFLDSTSFTAIKPIKITVKECKDLIEEDNFTQSNLLVAYNFCGYSTLHGRMVVSLANSIIGGSSSSKLFVNIREKLGLCYSISSVLGFKGEYLLVRAGISKENYEKTLKAIDYELLNLVKNVTDDELSLAKADMLNYLESSLDSSFAIARSLLNNSIVGIDFTVDEAKKIVAAITLNEIKEAVTEIKKLGSYFLKGVKNEEN